MRTTKLGAELSQKRKSDIYHFLMALDKVNYPMEKLLKRGLLPDIKDVCYNLVDCDNSYGYYISNNTLPKVYELLKRLKCKSFIDLGCGMNLTTNMLLQTENYFNSKSPIRFSGIERDKKLISYSKLFFYTDIPILEADLLNITAKDIQHADILYMYEPIHDRQMVKSFVDNLVNIMNFNQTILLKPAGEIEYALRGRSDIKELVDKNCPIRIFQKIKATKKVTTKSIL
jgi:SAM-dependent methyltransferase